MIDRRSVLAGVAALGAAASAPRIARAQTLETVAVGKLIGVSDCAFYIADKKGFFREAGVDVRWTTFPQSQQMVAPLANGQLDALGASVSAGIWNAIGRGIPLKIVGDRGIDYPPYGGLPLVVRTDLVRRGRFKTVRDLRGLKVAEPGKGTSNLAILVRFLRRAGLAYDDVEHVFLPFPDQLAALRNGALDASVLIEPFATAAIKEGYATKVGSDADIYPNHQISALMYSTRFMRERPEAARRFFVGYLRGLRYYHDALRGGRFAGPTANDVIAILQDFIKVPDPGIWREITPSGVSTNGRVDVPSLEFDYGIYKQYGFITNPANVLTSVDLSYADAAAKELGPYVAAR
jgi:NitT/TauT family transport system substrate-binding protein